MTANGAPRRAQRMLLAVLALAIGLALSTSASAVSLIVDPLQSSVTQGGSSQAVSGSVDITLTTPVLSNTAFDVVSLALTPLSVGLDPAAPNPGAGVVNAAGAFLIPTLFIVFDQGGGPQALALSNVSGTMQFGVGGALVGLQTSVQIDPGGGGAPLLFSIVAVPEPALGFLLAAAAVTLGRLRR